MPPTLDEARETARESFPMVEAISETDLREGVIDAWAFAMVDNDLPDLQAVQWYPTTQRKLQLGDEYLVDHVIDVTELSVGMAEELMSRRDIDISLDLVTVGALVHDVSKAYEFAGYEPTPVNELVGHPYYGVANAVRAGLPPNVSHIVLSHSPLTAVEPATMEALIVQCADRVAAAGIKTRATDDLRDA